MPIKQKNSKMNLKDIIHNSLQGSKRVNSDSIINTEFSDALESNRDILKEGNSLILSLIKNFSSDDNRFKRVNVQKITSLKDLFNSPISKVTFKVHSSDQINRISKYLSEAGKTTVNISYIDKKKCYNFQLKNKRNVDRKSINLLRNKEISTNIE